MGGAITLTGCCACAFFGNYALAQIIPDSTLGAEDSVVTLNANINGFPAERIDGGATRSTNLFHSFNQFDVPEGRRVFFANPVGIENIISRVTSNGISYIAGTLGVIGGNANLFLINPNGIIFGPNARLDVRGSFVATTANAIAFGSQGFFSASVHNVPPLLAVNPSAFFFNQVATAPIINQSVAKNLTNPQIVDGLRVPDGRSLLLVGGNVNLDGGVLKAPGGRVELGGLAGGGTVELSGSGSNLNLTFLPGVERADVFLLNGANVNVTNRESSSGIDNSGDIKIYANSFSLTEDARMDASTYRKGNAGNVLIEANGSVSFKTGAIFSNVESGGEGNGGDITIKGESLSLIDGAELQSVLREASGTLPAGRGQGGTIDVNASDSVSLSGGGGLFARATGNGSAGRVKITTNQLTIQDRAQVSVSNTGSGSTGNLEVKARSIFMNNQGNLTARTESGEGGNIRIQVADTLLLRNNSKILTSALGTGNGGNITINAGGFILAVLPENSDVAATAIQGRGGNIFVTAQGVFGFSLPERLVRTPDSDISAASELGINGTREFNARNNIPLVPLPDQFELPPVSQGCQVTDGEQTESTFVITGRGGLPPNPSEALRTEAVLVNGVAPQPELENRSTQQISNLATRSTPKRLVEAQGWAYNSKGQVVLTAQASTVIPYSPPRLNPKNCSAP